MSLGFSAVLSKPSHCRMTELGIGRDVEGDYENVL
jgi:hypothetical protein